MAGQAQAAVTACPFCPEEGARVDIHRHMVDAHPEQIEAWTDAKSGRMRYRVVCPICGADYEHRVKPRSTDPTFLTTFATEVRMVGFDMLLNHITAEHEEG
jgi:hypothetical protein